MWYQNRQCLSDPSPQSEAASQEGGRKYKPSLELFEQAKGLAGDQLVLVRCILLRAAFGGMAGDVQLLKGMQILSKAHLAVCCTYLLAP